ANVLSSLILIKANNSVRDSLKCSHKWLQTVLPLFLSSAWNRSVTIGTQPPQPVPARVHCLTAATESSCCWRIDSQICLLLMLLQEQTCASSAIEFVRSSPAPALPLPTTSSWGAQGSSVPALAKAESAPKSLASPTRTPPSRCFPSRLSS